MHQDITVVLGMHRSGTSCLTGQLQQAGLVLGEVMERAPFNRKGNRENPQIMSLNDDLLAHNGGSWHSPPDKVHWLKSHELRRESVLSKYNDFHRWGFKDPRSLFTLPFWLQGLAGEKVRLIGCIRHPLSVAKSLHNRSSDFSLVRGIELWRRYNEKLFDIQARHCFPLVDFDLEDGAYVASVKRALQYLELDSGHGQLNMDFFVEELRHQHNSVQIDDPVLSRTLHSVMPLYARLKTLVI